MGIPDGVLVQATVGGGWVLGQMFPYQKYVGLVVADARKTPSAPMTRVQRLHIQRP